METITLATELIEVLSQTVMNYHCDILRYGEIYQYRAIMF